MKINESEKKATILAKEGEFDEAIALLQKLTPQMARVGGFGNGGYTKIIPYFQKAGRYREGIDYSINALIPALKQDCYITFSQKCEEIQEAFIQLGVAQIYDKLRLCANRENNKEDEALYAQQSEESWKEYERLLSVGERIELRKGFEEAVEIYGPSIDSWPDIIKKRFTNLINP